MFLQLPFHLVPDLKQTILILNTVLLIAALIVVELVYSEKPREQRAPLKYFYPFFLVMVGLLLYAAYHQVGKA